LQDTTSDDSALPFAPRFAPETDPGAQHPPAADAELARVVAAWDTLSGPIKAAILAMIDAARR